MQEEPALGFGPGVGRSIKSKGAENMEFAAIRHFEDKRYCYALEKGRFLIRLETKRGDLARARLHTQEKYLPASLTKQTHEMTLACTDRYRDYYEAVVDIDVVCLRYFFEMEDAEGQTLYFGGHGFYSQPIQDAGLMFDCPQTLREEERFLLPGWARNKVVYQIFPSRFATDKEVSDAAWYQAPIDHAASLQGSLRGVIQRLDYLRELGVDILYMTPVFRSKSSHKYDIDDYYTIDPSFGTKEDLKELVRGAHDRGMYVVLDGVFNHSSTDFFAFRDLKEKGSQSEYRSWYYADHFPLTAKRGEKPSYKTFGYAGGMPKLNLQNKATADFVIDVSAYWIRECDIDGWRLDVADEISHSFWKRFRREIKAVKPEALIVGEIWHFAGDFLEGDEWDSVMNYPFRDGVRELIAGEDRRPSAFFEKLGFLRGNLHPCWNTPEENAAWVEYCNGGSSTKYGRLRAERGHEEPYHVQLWSLGNEFGYGHMEGDNTPGGYCQNALENGRKMLEASPNLSLCSSGPYPSKEWAELSARPLSSIAQLVSQHYYGYAPCYTSLAATEQEYDRCIASVSRMRALIRQCRQWLEPNVRISLDEWNVWYAWYRPSSVTDGVYAALAMHLLIEEAEKSGIAVACHFQAVNEGLLWVGPQEVSMTAQGQVFSLMQRHRGNRLCSASQEAVVTSSPEGEIAATVVNASFRREKTVDISSFGPCQEAALYFSATVLPPSVFEIKDVLDQVQADRTLTMPPHSVLFLRF